MIIAISGPAASGKGTLARMLAKELGLPHYDFGLMFRAVALLISRFGIERVFELAQSRRLRVDEENIFLRWVVLTTVLKTEEVGLLAAIAANSNLVQIIKIAQTMVVHDSFVCDGRTCGTEIYQYAEYKFYITADEAERFSRRLKDGGSVNVLSEREKLDNVRLRIPDSAIIINTTGKTKEESLQELLSFLK